jgi:hypothetical protein
MKGQRNFAEKEQHVKHLQFKPVIKQVLSAVH